jgi:hypothetical protein
MGLSRLRLQQVVSNLLGTDPDIAANLMKMIWLTSYHLPSHPVVTRRPRRGASMEPGQNPRLVADRDTVITADHATSDSRRRTAHANT